jgi:hypothetical protein
MQGGAAEDVATPLPLARHMPPRRQGGARIGSAAPPRVARHEGVRRWGAWCGTLGFVNPPRPGPHPTAPLPHFSPSPLPPSSMAAAVGVLSLPLL